MHSTTDVVLLRAYFTDLVLNIRHISLSFKTKALKIFALDDYFVSSLQSIQKCTQVFIQCLCHCCRCQVLIDFVSISRFIQNSQILELRETCSYLFRCSCKVAKSDTFILCVSLFVCLHRTCLSSHGMEFHEILCWMFVLKCVEKIHFWLKLDEKAHILNEGFFKLMILPCRLLLG